MIKNILIAVFAVGTLAGVASSSFLYLRYSSSRPIMRVGNEAITRKDFEERVEYAAGKAILTKMAYHKMIMQAAQKANAVPTEKDVDARIAEIERRTPAVLEEAKHNPVKMADLRQDILSDIAFENLRIKDVKLSDGDVAAYYAQNKAMFGVPAQAQTTVAVAQNSVDAETAKGLLSQGIKPETIARQPRLRVVGIDGFQINASQIPPELATRLNKAVFSMQEGDITSIPAGSSFLILRVNKRAVAGVPPLETVRPLVERMAKLGQAPPADVTLAKLYKDAPVVFEVDKYSAYFSDIQAKASENAPLGSGTNGIKKANNASATPSPIAAATRP